MGYLNYEFFDEFKALDNLCRDIYGESIDNKLGVTLYLEDMDRKAYQGAFKVSVVTRAIIGEMCLPNITEQLFRMTRTTIR